MFKRPKERLEEKKKKRRAVQLMWQEIIVLAGAGCVEFWLAGHLF